MLWGGPLMVNFEHTKYLLEIFKLDTKNIFKYLYNTPFNIYEPIESEKIKNLFSKRSALAYYSYNLTSKNHVNTFVKYKDQFYIISTDDISNEIINVFGKYEKKYEVSFKKINDKNFKDIENENPNVLNNFLLNGIRNLLPKNYNYEGSTIYDKTIDLISDSNIIPISPILKTLKVHPGANIYIKKYNDKYYLQVSPTTKLTSSESINEMLKNEENNIYVNNLEFVRLGIGRNATLRNISNKKANESISREPFDGQNFIEFAKKSYPNIRFYEKNSKLAIVIPTGLTNSWIFSTEQIYPSFNFWSINNLDHNYFRKFLGVIKSRSIERLENAIEIAEKINPFILFGEVIEIDKYPHTIDILSKAQFLRYGKLNYSNIGDFPKGELGTVFESAPISLRMFLNKEYVEKTIYPGREGFSGTLNDLMKRNSLAPLEILDEIKTIFIIDKSLERRWHGEKIIEKFKESLIEGVEDARSSYRGFRNTFKSNLNIIKTYYVEDILSDELDDIIKNISPENCDCVVLIIPRKADNPELTKLIYLTPKEKIMHKGIPVQAIVDDAIDIRRTLKMKLNNPYTMYGIALNIAAKTGSRLTSFSEEFSEKIVGNTVIIGYNITRIMPKPRYIRQDVNIEELAGKTIPLVTPLFIIDNRGSQILHWDFYRPTSEVSLFSEFGEDILKHVNNDVNRIIIHKDGKFTEEELQSIHEISNDREIIPISITHWGSIRMHNSQFIGVGSEVARGTYIKLDDMYYQLCNTTIHKWNPEAWGWPVPLTIQFHYEYDNVEKIKFLHHIFSLTKMHFGSQRPTRSPTSIHYSNLVSRFLRKLGDEAPSFHEGFKDIYNKYNRMPLWFL